MGSRQLPSAVPFGRSVLVGGTESLQITAEDNIAPVVEAVVAGGRLTIGIRPGTPGISSSLGVMCRIGARAIRDIEMSGAGRIEMDGIDAPELWIRLSGAASFSGSGSVERLRIDLSGASRFTAPSLRARATDSALAGASVALVRVVDALTVHASGASVFEYFGDPAVQTDASGASVVRRVGPDGASDGQEGLLRRNDIVRDGPFIERVHLRG